MNKDTATQRLPQIVQLVATDYFKREKEERASDREAQAALNELIIKVQEEGIGPIWDSTKDTVDDRMREYRPAFANEEEFLALIESGLYLFVDVALIELGQEMEEGQMGIEAQNKVLSSTSVNSMF